MRQNNKKLLSKEKVSGNDGLYTNEGIEKLFAAVREQMERVPYLIKHKSFKIFILNVILISGLEYGEVMSYLYSLNAFGENDKGWKKVSLNMSIEEKFDALGWKKVVKRLIELATHKDGCISLEETVKSTKENPTIKEILLQERTSGTKFGINTNEVVPRYLKPKATKKERTKTKAEVFTPIEVVKKMNDSFDKEYKGFDLDYIKRTVLEVTCGEAPFLTTRYDPYTGQSIPVGERVGLLDRKLQHIHTDDETEWCRLAELALKSTFGYEWQEDSLYLARMNVLLSVVESFTDQFGKMPKNVEKWAEIVSYNLFRMDGLTLCLPETDTPVMIMNWETGKMERFDGEEETHRSSKKKPERNTQRKREKNHNSASISLAA